MPSAAIALKIAGGHAGAVGHVVDRDLRLVGVQGDAADQHAFHVVVLLDPGSLVLLERRADVQRHARPARHLDRAGLQHLRAGRRQLEHLVVGDAVDLARVGDDPRVGRVDAVHVGVDLADVGADRAGHRHRGQVRAAAAERRDLVLARQALEPRQDHDVAGVERLLDRASGGSRRSSRRRAGCR